MSDTRELYRAMEEAGQRRGSRLRGKAWAQFDEARELAAKYGFTLKRHTDVHYQLTDGQWLMNIYPGKRRLYHDRNKPAPPFLDVPHGWGLLDVVTAALKAKLKGET
jgi:hypothetical protein